MSAAPQLQPSRPAVFIETYGCAFNQADSETLAGLLLEAGYALVDAPELAEVIVLNTCTVKDRTWAHFEHRFRTLKQAAANGSGPAVVVAGCIPKTPESRLLLDGVSAIAPSQVARIVDAVEAARSGSPLHLLANPPAESRLERPNLPARRNQPHIEILPLAAGCLSACSFCQTRLARGRLQSFRPGDLLRRARAAAEAGVAEIWLTAQDTGAYGHDIDYPLPRLLRELCRIEGDFRIRLGMCSPIWIHQRLDEYLEAFEDPKLLTTWHLPVQSGSDAVLRHMGRDNTASDFVQIAEAFHARFPDGALITDIIVGYPTETEADFAQTMILLQAISPAGVNRSKFSPRPGTSAANLKALPIRTVKSRMSSLTTKCAELGHAWHGRFIGQRQRIRLIEQKRNGSTIGHNQSGRPAIITGKWPFSHWVDVEITSAASYHFIAMPVSGSELSPQVV